jgi:hypothetical protein
VKQRMAELERQVKERAEAVKTVLREYRESLRADPSGANGLSGSSGLHRKRLDVQRANAEYMRIQKELDLLRSRARARTRE